MDPRDFRELADRLAGGASPAEYRSAISRAYYAAFHVGIETLHALGFRVSRGAAGHGEVARCFDNCANQEAVNAARSLSNLHTLRIRADYQLDRLDVESAAVAVKAVKQAQSVIDAFDRILTGPQRTSIESAILAWRKSNGYP
jgi:uncharacterized protein (UPF0332 family)